MSGVGKGSGGDGDGDWEAADWDGLRDLRLRAFQALPLREKLGRLEQMAEVARRLGACAGTDGASSPGPREGRPEPELDDGPGPHG